MELAIKGAGLVNPNPQVGAVLTKNNTIIGEGYHQQFGGPHAEINAFDHAISDVRDATLYVTMEPCNHYGKTPPCTDRIIKEKIKRVVVGTTDPNIRVFEKGIAQLRAAGIAVDVIEGELQREIMKMNEIYNHFTRTGLPFTALKSAMTLDGKIATYSGYSKWITNEKSRAMVHELRHTYAAIMVGVNTIITDNPALTDRSNHAVRQHPLRIIVDSSGRTPLDAAVLNTEEAPTLIAVTQKASPDFMNQMKDRGASVMVCPEKDQKVDLAYLNRELGQMNIDSILLEGGSTLNFSALEAGIVHKIFAFISPKLVGGRKAFTPVGGQGFEKMEQAITLNVDSIHRFDEDIMIEAYLMKIKDVHGNH
jgi:diaminohydroxyphosphoribosylaminopyrimidine deaminase/5-amino-6-(5-phosphoribosylamino)uracil reductase